MPELSGVEYETNLYVTKILSQYNVKIINNNLSIVCYFDKGKNDTIAFRSELDGLPITEDFNHNLRSQNMCMHACGHDVHTSALLQLAQYIDENYFTSNIALIFQSKEETGLGAKDLIETNIIEQLNITKIIAMHVWPNLKYNTIFSAQNLMFGSYELDILIEGENNHISSYNPLFDATRASFLIYKKLYKNKKNYISHLGEISSGNMRNISSNKALLKYSIRFKSNKKITQKISSTNIDSKCKISYDFKSYFPPVINDKELLSIHNHTKIKTLKSAEDFGYYSCKCKTLYLLYGLGKAFPLHSAKFNVNKKTRQNYYFKLLEILDVYKL